MNEYIGKICPYCKVPIKTDDEIVVCSVCDMPHHKDCWVENQGCTTFGCTGTIKIADGSATSVTSKFLVIDDFVDSSSQIFCTRCGAKNHSSSSFCCKCGNSLQTSPAQSDTRSHLNTPSNNHWQGAGHSWNNGVFGSGATHYAQPDSNCIDSDALLYIGPKSEYYFQKFNEMKSLNKKTSWNWCAFLVAPYWMIYRKMYAYGAAVLGGAFVLSFFGIIGSLLSLGGYIALGFLGNYIYMLQIEKNISQGKIIGDYNKSLYASKVGGTNTAATALTIVGYLILIFIINFA